MVVLGHGRGPTQFLSDLVHKWLVDNGYTVSTRPELIEDEECLNSIISNLVDLNEYGPLDHQ